ncbi:EamA family transporter [Mycobacterium spongiae]|uniref:EamA family transporter n=1 Tax=Mycobacterium spongiae TaxID=886343 RepID=A0A975K0V4_9MYCO|nr:EamA family transporter [Mycobacterium spongiae]QUR68988.1 EamA family transporter [Mycobacterium spongiae]
MAPSRTPSAVLMIVGSCISLQLGSAIATPLLAHFGAGLITSLRLLLAAAILMTVHRPRVFGWDHRQWTSAVLFAVAFAGMNGFFFAAIARIPLGVAVTIEFAGPLVLAAALSRRQRDLGCVVVAAAAIVALSWDSAKSAVHPDLLGVVFALIAACFWAFYILAGKYATGQLSGQGVLPISMFIGAIAVLPFGVPALPALAGEPEKLFPLLGVAVLSSMLPYSLEFAAMRRLSAQTFGVLLSLEPVVAGLAGWLVLHQDLGWLRALAMLVVVAASVTSALSQPSAASEPDSGTFDSDPGPKNAERRAAQHGSEPRTKANPVSVSV